MKEWSLPISWVLFAIVTVLFLNLSWILLDREEEHSGDFNYIYPLISNASYLELWYQSFGDLEQGRFVNYRPIWHTLIKLLGQNKDASNYFSLFLFAVNGALLFHFLLNRNIALLLLFYSSPYVLPRYHFSVYYFTALIVTYMIIILKCPKPFVPLVYLLAMFTKESTICLSVILIYRFGWRYTHVYGITALYLLVRTFVLYGNSFNYNSYTIIGWGGYLLYDTNEYSAWAYLDYVIKNTVHPLFPFWNGIGRIADPIKLGPALSTMILTCLLSTKLFDRIDWTDKTWWMFWGVFVLYSCCHFPVFRYRYFIVQHALVCSMLAYTYKQDKNTNLIALPILITLSNVLPVIAHTILQMEGVVE